MIIKKSVDGKKYKVMFFSPDGDWKYTLSQFQEQLIILQKGAVNSFYFTERKLFFIFNFVFTEKN